MLSNTFFVFLSGHYQKSSRWVYYLTVFLYLVINIGVLSSLKSTFKLNYEKRKDFYIFH